MRVVRRVRHGARPVAATRHDTTGPVRSVRDRRSVVGLGPGFGLVLAEPPRLVAPVGDVHHDGVRATEEVRPQPAR